MNLSENKRVICNALSHPFDSKRVVCSYFGINGLGMKQQVSFLVSGGNELAVNGWSGALSSALSA
jgi:hypothetical protein